jgi:competence protein ComEC
MVCVVVALTPWPDFDHRLELYFPNVGQGGACLIKWPDGRHWLVDAGPPGNQMLHWLRRKRIHTVDRLFLSHADLDHMGGFLPILNQLHVREIWISRPPIENVHAFEEFTSTAKKHRIPIHHWEQSNSASGSDNDTGLVLTIRHGTHRFLLLGDVGKAVENRLAKRMPTMTLVQVAHHGSTTSSSRDMIIKSQADYAVIQVGKANRYGLPKPEVVERWAQQKVLRTDLHGTIHVQTDGNRLTLRSWTPQDLWQNRLE